MNKKILELVDIIQTLFYPLTKSHTIAQTYYVNPDTSIIISPKYASLGRCAFAYNHLDIHTSDGKSSLIQVYSDYDCKDLDQVIIDVMNLYNNGISKETMLDRLKRQQKELETKIKSIEDNE